MGLTVLVTAGVTVLHSLAGQHVPGRPDSDAAGIGSDVRHPDQEPVSAGAPGAEGVLLLHHGGHQQAENQAGVEDTVDNGD